jgi:hypothetical protein
MSTSPTVTAGDHEFLVAFHHLNYTPPGGIEVVGFDLDGKCTGQGEGSSCRPPVWAGPHQDGPEGRDNSVTASFLADAGTRAEQAKQADDSVEKGLITTVMRVRHYNGLPIDGSVDVDVFGVTRSPNLLAQEPNPATWDGSAVWKPIVEWLLPVTTADGGELWNAGHPKYTSSQAYVVDNTLVAHFDTARGAPNFNFSNLWIQARMEDPKGDGKWSLRDGVYAGRLRIDDVLGNTEYTPDPATGKPFTCTDSESYLQTKRSTCAAADIGFAGDDPEAPCDAASWAWMFDADPAQLSDEVDMTRAGDFHVCPEGSRPSEDHCASLDGDAH